MSTSPSWFDQDKFSRLVKKVGPKTPAGQPAASQAAPANAPSQPLVKEAPLPPENKDDAEPPVPKPATGPRLSVVKEASLPQAPKEEEKPSPPPTPKAPPIEPPGEATRLSQRLPKIEAKEAPVEEKLIPPPIRADAGPAPTAEIEEEAPPLPGAVTRAPLSIQKMMTSQPLSFIKKSAAPPAPSDMVTRTEPLRAPAPEASSALPLPKTPPLPEGAQATPSLPRRTAPLPALKSLFQYEIPGGQGVIPAKPPVETPAPKATLPTFTFQKPAARPPTVILPPAPDVEEDVPSFAGLSDAGKLAEAAEGELSAENLAAEWGKADELKEDLERITRERDEIRSEYIKLRGDFEKLKQEKPTPKMDQSGPVPSHLNAEDSDAFKKEISDLKKEIETLQKQVEEKDREIGAAKTTSTGMSDVVDTLKGEVETLRKQLEEKDREIHAVKTSSTGINDVVDTLKSELETLKEQAKKAKEDASAAQRGLALSQKALQDTREALREASESAKKLA